MILTHSARYLLLGHAMPYTSPKYRQHKQKKNTKRTDKMTHTQINTLHSGLIIKLKPTIIENTALKFETERTDAVCFKNLECLTEANMWRLVNPIICRMRLTLPNDTYKPTIYLLTYLHNGYACVCGGWSEPYPCATVVHGGNAVHVKHV